MPPKHLPATHNVSAGADLAYAEDARELAEFFDGQDAVDVMAAQWLAQQEEGLDAAQTQAFEAWLAADPAHRQAYASLHSLMGKVAEMPKPSLHIPRQPVDKQDRVPRTITPFARGFKWGLHRGTAYLLAIVVVCAAGWHVAQDKEVFAATYTTARNEQRDIALPDNSQLTLDTKTTVNVSFTDHKRVVTLPEGQAFFNIAAKDNMPFEVVAGKSRITVVGTRFSVRYTQDGIHPEMTHLAVEEGHVRIVKDSWWPWQSPVDLRAGDTIAMAKDGQLGEVSHTDYPAPALLWRTGRVNFNNVPLSEALSEFERYGDTHVVIRDPAIAQLRLQGSFDLQRIDAFMRAVPQVLPVYPVRHGQQTVLVRAPEVDIK